jgi:hypothetical protein
MVLGELSLVEMICSLLYSFGEGIAFGGRIVGDFERFPLIADFDELQYGWWSPVWWCVVFHSAELARGEWLVGWLVGWSWMELRIRTHRDERIDRSYWVFPEMRFHWRRAC